VSFLQVLRAILLVRAPEKLHGVTDVEIHVFPDGDAFHAGRLAVVILRMVYDIVHLASKTAPLRATAAWRFATDRQ
jgi:hypothetical protein